MEPRVKDKSIAPIQITAEQLIREASERIGGEGRNKRGYVDSGDLQEYRQRLRKQCEEAVGRNRGNLAAWLRYAKFEVEQQDLGRARSVYERCLDHFPTHQTVWLRYAEMESSHQNYNLARNIWDRAVTVLPRMSLFWFKYLKMEESLGQIERCRAIWDRWLQWEPDDAIWLTAVRFEVRYLQWELARQRFEKLLSIRPEHADSWISYAQFEEQDAKDVPRCRQVYERSVHSIHGPTPRVFIEFAKFELRQKEIERVRTIYQFAMSKFSDHAGLQNSYVQFEKLHGDPRAIDTLVLQKRRRHYEQVLESHPFDYDTWHEYIFLLIGTETTTDIVKDSFEKAIQNIPKLLEKHSWQRYIYIWLFYALHLEISCKNDKEALKILKRAVDVIPHKIFTFAKLWNELAEWHVRHRDIVQARKSFGLALGLCQGSSESVFERYIEMEMRIREFDRVRQIYQTWVATHPQRAHVWIKWAEFEALLQDVERARSLFELAIEQEDLDWPETVWKSYMDYEFDLQEYERVRNLYERLLRKTEHLKVWISYSTFELSITQNDRIDKARVIMERASQVLRSLPLERQLLFSAYLEMEQLYGTDDSIKTITERQPQQVHRKRTTLDGKIEEYTELTFPDDNRGMNKILEMAQIWKQQQKHTEE